MNEQLKNVLTQSEIKFELIRSNRNASSDELFEQLLRYALNNVHFYRKDVLYDFKRIADLELSVDDEHRPAPFSFVIFYRKTGSWIVQFSEPKCDKDLLESIVEVFSSDYFIYVEKEVTCGDCNYVYEYYKIMR